jgi:DNA-3-methyladenine glycosylase
MRTLRDRKASGPRPQASERAATLLVGGGRAVLRPGPSGLGSVLPRSFFERPTLTVAAALLGKILVHRTGAGIAAGMIVETEAYIGEDDPACHAAHGPTMRNAPLYGPPGIAYVYLNYGIHYLVNAVTESEGSPAAVLIRALEPVDGIALMTRRRRPEKGGPDPITNLCRGPGNLTQALGISLAENRLDLTSSRLSIEDRGHVPSRIVWGPRIGIRVGTDRHWRCWIDGHRCVSGPQSRARARATMS